MEEVEIMRENCYDMESYEATKRGFETVPVSIGGCHQGVGGVRSAPLGPLRTLEDVAKGFSQGAKGTAIRSFSSGANRSSSEGKPDYEGFISPLVTARYGEYMHKHRALPDGTLRASDNWQKGIPKEELVKSGYRHFHDWLMHNDGYATVEPIEESLCALIFNASGYLVQLLQEREYRKA